MEQKEKHFNLSWFFKWFLDNKAVTVFLVALLLGLNIFILSKISFLFIPVVDFLSVVMLIAFLSLKSTGGFDGEVQDKSCLSH